MEIEMEEPRRNAEQPTRDFGENVAGGTATAERAVDTAMTAAERISEASASQAERAVAESRRGLYRATRTAESGARAALRSGGTIAEGVSQIAQTWTHYAEEVMRYNSQASQALLRCRSWNEVLEVQANLLRDNMHAFLDQSAKVAEIGSRMATHPFEALAEAGSDRPH
jgi:hypothetical protein